jgi:hypothetical protein
VHRVEGGHGSQQGNPLERKDVSSSHDSDAWIGGWEQGCQIFLDTIYQNGEIYTRVPNGHKIYQKAVKFSNWP